jgi:ABC-type glycerol-3-phosphate transport system substrate-binding protein
MFGAEPEDLYDAEAKKFLKPKELYDAWEWVQSMAVEYGAEDLQKFVAGFGDWGTEAEPFLSGKMAMTWNGPWIADHISKFAPDMDWGVASAPTVAENVKKGDFAWIGIDTMSIPKGAKHVEEAIDFMIWFSSKEGQFYMNTGEKGSGRCPTVVDFGGQEFYDACVANPQIEKFMDIMASPAVLPIPFGTPAEQAYNTEFSAILEPVLTLEMDARDAVDLAVERAQTALDKLR